jgi:hypothetical protein
MSYSMHSQSDAADTAEFPDVDDHIVTPETREEMLRGVLMFQPYADAPHADLHARLSMLIAHHVAPGYVASTGLLTRFAADSDFGTSVCVRKAGIDPTTGARYLEELAFEIVSERPPEEVRMRAEVMAARGVRRLIAIFVNDSTVGQWDRDTGRYEPWGHPGDGKLVDPTLLRPIPLRVLFDHRLALDEVVREGEGKLRREGELAGFRQRERIRTLDD